MSKSSHLRPEAGGDPTRSNSTDLKHEPKAPQDDNDFPDAPEQADDEKPQDKPDLDAFAKRMGTDTIESGDGLGKDSRLIIAGGGGAVVAAAAAILALVAGRRRKRRHLLVKATALGAMAKVISN